MAYAILRTSKLKSAGNIGALNDHIHRLRPTPNADQELSHLNRQLRGSKDLQADIQIRLDEVGCKVRTNAVLAVEHVLTFSPEFLNIQKVPYTDGTPTLKFATKEDGNKFTAFRELAMDWLEDRYGKANVVNAVLHLDEQTPHIHATVVPIDERGKLNCRSFLGGRDKMRDMQSGFAARMAPLGLQRGIEGSTAHHQEVKRFYGLVKELNPQLAQDVYAQRQVAQHHVREFEQRRRGGLEI